MKKVFETVSVLIIVIVFVGLGMTPILSPWIQKPQNRTFNGMHGYLDDYVGYASYVKEGMYGLTTFRIRSLPKGQSATTANLVYIWAGYIAKIFRLDAPSGYHAARAFLGVVFVFVTFLLMKNLLHAHWYAIGATVLAFLSSAPGWYTYVNNSWVYTPFSTFSFIDNVAGRVTTRPHYILGATLFLILIQLLISNKSVLTTVGLRISANRLTSKIFHYYGTVTYFFVCVLFFGLGLMLGITHPSFAIILLMTMGLVFIVRILPKEKQSIVFYVITIVGLLVGVLLSKWSTSVEPYVSILAFEEYVYYERLSIATVINDIKTFGPTLWIGFPTLLFVVIKTHGKSTKDLIVFFWLLVHFILFFSLYSLFRAERFRFIQSLYFIPMAYGTMLLFKNIAKRIGHWISVLSFGVLICLFIPSYIQGFLTDYYAITDYRSWSSLYFPFEYQMEAYRYLDANTPKESTVIASFEASNHIILYSHNYVIGNTQGWPRSNQIIMVRDRDNFFSGTMKEQDAKDLLKKYDVSFVYNGWQERTLGDVRRYGFLRKVFDNTDVEIYAVD